MTSLYVDFDEWCEESGIGAEEDGGAWSYRGYMSPKLQYAKILAMLSFLGMLFNGFIIFREVMYIHTYCLLCLLCTAIIVSIFLISLSMLKKRG
jgi:uncharacterized membrane protein